MTNILYPSYALIIIRYFSTLPQCKCMRVCVSECESKSAINQFNIYYCYAYSVTRYNANRTTEMINFVVRVWGKLSPCDSCSHTYDDYELCRRAPMHTWYLSALRVMCVKLSVCACVSESAQFTNDWFVWDSLKQFNRHVNFTPLNRSNHTH